MNRKKLTALMLSTVMAFTPAAPIVASETAVHSVENAEDIAVSSATDDSNAARSWQCREWKKSNSVRLPA